MRGARDLSNHLNGLGDRSREREGQAVGCRDGECDTRIRKSACGRCDVNRKGAATELSSASCRLWNDDARIPQNARIEERESALVLNPVDVKVQSARLVDAGPVPHHGLRRARVDWLRRAATTGGDCGSQQNGSSSATAQKIPRRKQR